jgi:hypothetical protein
VTRLALTKTNEKLLKMTPHPGAPVQYLPAGGIIVTAPAPTHTVTSPPANGTQLGKTRLLNDIHAGAYANATGTAALVRAHGQVGLVVNASGLPRTSPQPAYGLWLISATTPDSRFLGYITGQPNHGCASVDVALPPVALKRYGSVELTIEAGQSAPSQPGKVVLRGKLP